MNICIKTGLSFEGTSRQKNHPEVSKILTESNRYGSYRTVLNACDSVKSQEMIELDALVFLNAVMKESNEQYVNNLFEETARYKANRKENARLINEELKNPKRVKLEEELYQEDLAYKSNFVESISEF